MNGHSDQVFPHWAKNQARDITVREYFAAQMMAGYNANANANAAGVDANKRAQWAVSDADALIAALAYGVETA